MKWRWLKYPRQSSFNICTNMLAIICILLPACTHCYFHACIHAQLYTYLHTYMDSRMHKCYIQTVLMHTSSIEAGLHLHKYAQTKCMHASMHICIRTDVQKSLSFFHDAYLEIEYSGLQHISQSARVGMNERMNVWDKNRETERGEWERGRLLLSPSISMYVCTYMCMYVCMYV